MTVAYHRRIIPNNIDFKVVREGRRSLIEAKLISVGGITYNLKLDSPKLSNTNATNMEDFCQSLDTEEIEFVDIFGDSTQCGNTKHISWRIDVYLKDKPMFQIQCSKIHGLPKY